MTYIEFIAECKKMALGDELDHNDYSLEEILSILKDHEQAFINQECK